MYSKRNARHFILVIVLMGIGGLGGCSSGSDTIVEQNQQTYGQQLIDLKAAYDKGILSEREYNKSRDAIVDKMKK
jgi:hypothetical protein